MRLSFQYSGSFAERLHVGGQRPGDRWWRARTDRRPVCLERPADEVIVIGLGNSQSVAGEYQFGLYLLRLDRSAAG